MVNWWGKDGILNLVTGTLNAWRWLGQETGLEGRR
jgi:hypothetical protein